MPSLILINGLPASGKSTLARKLADLRPLSLNLDIDVIRHQLGAWMQDPTAAGNTARNLALAMARTHLIAGHDVVVPQFLARTEFMNELSRLAVEVDASYIEVLLEIDVDLARATFQKRTETGSDPTHRDAAALIARSGVSNPFMQMQDALDGIKADRPQIRSVAVVPDDVEATLATLLETVGAAGNAAVD